jgi:hypothetical protein
MEEDGLNILQRVLAKIHNHLLLWQNFQQDNFVDGYIICHPYHEQHHLHCTSIGIAKEFIGLLKTVPNSHCVEAMNNKGILVHIISSENILKPKEVKAEVNVYL